MSDQGNVLTAGPDAMAQVAAAGGALAAEVLIAEEFGWKRIEADGAELFLKGHVRGADPDDLLAEGLAAAISGETASAEWLASLDGHFALVIRNAKVALAAVDRVRSIPLIHARDGESALFSELGRPLVERLALSPADADPTAVLAIAMSGFTIGQDTMYPAIRQIGPGEFVLAPSGEPTKTARYHRWTPWKPADAEPQDLADRLSGLNAHIIQKLVNSLGGRRVLVPLSAGFDSRFVAAGLKAAGYDNVVCFSYGQPGNHEAATAREIASRLGYDWRFTPYTIGRQRVAMTGAEYARFEAMSDSLTGVHFPQEYLAFEQLVAAGVADEDAVVVNGQAGDFIAGNHIPATLLGPERLGGSDVQRRGRILDALMSKHYRLWRSLMTPENNALVRSRLDSEIDRLGGMPDDPAHDYGIFEYCEFQDRQSKYVLNGQRHYEYFGLDWRLPLWDRDYMDFWAAAPLSAKRGQTLYRDVLLRDNWAGVWRDIPVNAKTIRPSWLRPIRWAAKALHAPLGRDRWHAFERRYLQYWMATTCTYGKWPWRQVAKDRRGHWNQIALHVADYLSAKGWSIDDSVRPTPS